MLWTITSGGREYDVGTTSGANDFLKAIVSSTSDGESVTAANFQVVMGQQIHNANVARDLLTRMESVFQQTQPLSNLIQKCAEPYILIDLLATVAHPQVFAAIPDPEHTKLVQHACQVFGRLATCPKWTMTGIFQDHDEALLMAIMNCYKHKGFLQPSVDAKLMDTLATFSRSCCAPVMPRTDVAQSLRVVVLHYRSILIQEHNTPKEEIYKWLEESGMLAQYFRLATVPGVAVPGMDHVVTNDASGMRIIVDEIHQCKVLIKNKLKRSLATGQVLNAVISGEDGYRGTRDATTSATLLALQNKSQQGFCYTCGKVGTLDC
jgi:hypothetical protein